MLSTLPKPRIAIGYSTITLPDKVTLTYAFLSKEKILVVVIHLPKFYIYEFMNEMGQRMGNGISPFFSLRFIHWWSMTGHQ